MNLLALTLILCFVIFVSRGKFTEDDDEYENTKGKQVKYTQPFRPPHVAHITEGSLFKLLQKHDIVCVLVIQLRDCLDCATAHEQFLSVAEMATTQKEEMLPLVDVTMIKFGILNVDEEADEYSSWMNDNPDYHWYVPSIRIFKREFYYEYRRPPISFLINEHIGRDLPGFLLRMVGPPITTVKTQEQLVRRVTSPATSGISFGIWTKNPVPALFRVMERERFNVLFHNLTEAEEAVRASFNPQKGDITVYHFALPPTRDPIDDGNELPDPENTIVAHSMNIPRNVESVKQHKAIDDFVQFWKTKRPGHEYDLSTELVIDDKHVPENCPRSTKDSRFYASVKAFNLATDVPLLEIVNEELTPGKFRPDLPQVVTGKALIGVCPGMERWVIVPPGQGYKRRQPPGMDEEDRSKFVIKVHRWSKGFGPDDSKTGSNIAQEGGSETPQQQNSDL